MIKVNSYEFLGVLVPGVILIYGLSLLFPEMGFLKEAEKISFGELGLMLVLGFAAGQLVQSFGNAVEAVWWGIWRWPRDWVRTKSRGILANHQYPLVYEKIRSTLKLEHALDPHKISPGDWLAITRQLYAAVSNAGRTARIDVFNGNYGMFRGIAAAVIILIAAGGVAQRISDWRLYFGLVFMLVLALARMHRFAVYYSRELFVQFLELGTTVPAAVEVPAEHRDA